MLLQGIRRQGDDGNPALIRIQLSNTPSRFVTIQYGHLTIHQNQIVIPLDHRLYRFRSVMGNR